MKALPRVSVPQLIFLPLVALPFDCELVSFPLSKLNDLELLLGFVVLFTVALLSTTCEEKSSQADIEELK